MEKKCVYDYQNRCTCADDDNCGCTYDNNMAGDFSCNFDKNSMVKKQSYTANLTTKNST